MTVVRANMPVVVARRIISDLEAFGAHRAQLVDLGDTTDPRVLPYLDLIRVPAQAAPVVFEVNGKARAFVFPNESPRSPIPWIRRIALRGDADWVGVLSPGRIDFYRAALDGRNSPTPEALPEGPFLFPSLVHMRAPQAPSVRVALLTLLRRSVDDARKLSVEPDDALSLVGRALFWRFLLDRGLLDGLKPSSVCLNATSFESCLDSKTRALETFSWLEQTFNGSLLPFKKSARHFPAEVFERIVGNIAHGATADGQLSLRLPVEWRDINFAHIPVGLLSEVYEGFSHSEHEEKAKAESVFYTPRHIAEFVVDEALAANDEDEPRVLDPACGAGVFLVAAFRALVARAWKRSGQQPSRKIVRRILNRQLVGFDINDSALRLSELALYLTAIELDPDSKPRPLDLLRFSALRGETLVQVQGGAGVGSLGPVEEKFRNRFSLVIGNPPWTATVSGAVKDKWVDDTRPRIIELLGEERALAFELPDTNPDLPFVYRATEWAKEGGAIALATHARWVFGQSEPAVAARTDLLESISVTGILNGAALRRSHVWPSIESPFCILFAVNERPKADATLQFISPELETPDRSQQHLRIDWSDAHDIAVSEVIAKPWLLKARFRGTSFDEALIDDLLSRGPRLGDYLESVGAAIRNGYQTGGSKGKQNSARHMNGLPDLRGVEPVFRLDVSELGLFKRATLLRPRDPEIYRAPLLLIHESMRNDPMLPRSIVSLDDVAYDERFSGASLAGVDDGAQLAMYLQLLIQSAVFTHALLFLDGQFGVEREVVHKETINQVPVIPWHALSAEARRSAKSLASRLRAGMTPALKQDIDTFAFDVFGLSDIQRQAIDDTLRVALPTKVAKATAASPTSELERTAFRETCEAELRDMTGRAVSVEAVDAAPGPWHFVRVCWHGRVKTKQPLDARAFVASADEGSASLVVVHAEKNVTFVGLLDQFRYWTRTRARLLASELASERQDA